MTDKNDAQTAHEMARHFVEAEGEQIVRDMAGHLGDQLFDTMRRNGMTMRTVAGSIGILTLAAAQVLNQADDFLRRSLADDTDDEPPVETDGAGAIALLFAGELAPGLRAALSCASAPPPEDTTGAGVDDMGFAKRIADQVVPEDSDLTEAAYYHDWLVARDAVLTALAYPEGRAALTEAGSRS